MQRTPCRLPLTYILLACLALLPAPVIGVELDHPLFRAVRDRDESRLARLLRQGTPVNLRAADGTTPLMAAALHGSAEALQSLLAHGADPNLANDRGVTALLWAISELEKVQLLLDHGADVEAASNWGNTPLLVAASLPGGVATVERLLEQGADIATRNGRGDSALLNACRAGSTPTVKKLLAHAESRDRLPQLLGDDGTELLEVAASMSSIEVVEILIDSLHSTLGENSLEMSQALNAALRAQHTDVARLLLARGAAVDKKMGSVPSVMFATYNEIDDPSVLQALLAREVDINATNYAGENALTWARRRGHAKLIEALIDAGAAELPDESPEIPQREIQLTPQNGPPLLTVAVRKGIDLLQQSSDTFLELRKSCVSCHHQNLPAVAIGWARDRGLPVDQQSIQRLVQRQRNQLGGSEVFINRCYQLDNPAPVPPRYLGWGLWGFSALGHPRNETTDAAAWYLAATQRPDGRWTTNMLRPPIGDSDFTSTVLAMQVLQLYPVAGRAAEFDARIERAARWLETTEPRSHQERVYQLLGLSWAGRSPEQLQELAVRLQAAQREDGGWAQFPPLASDAWATGQTLVALQASGTLSVTDRAYQHGLEFLLSTQFDDGSWYVKSRSWPFQPPFESGFPFGRDQWISAAATAWSVMAMTLALPPAEVRLAETIITQPESDAPPEPTSDTAENSDSVNEDEDEDTVSEDEAIVAGQESAAIVHFAKQIQPLLERSCVNCHSGEEPQGMLSLTDRKSMLRGGETGTPGVVPGASADSLLFRAASQTHPELRMPPPDQREKYPPLSAAELTNLKRWIDQGAAWPKGVKLVAEPY